MYVYIIYYTIYFIEIISQLCFLPSTTSHQLEQLDDDSYRYPPREFSRDSLFFTPFPSNVPAP